VVGLLLSPPDTECRSPGSGWGGLCQVNVDNHLCGLIANDPQGIGPGIGWNYPDGARDGMLSVDCQEGLAWYVCYQGEIAFVFPICKID
jgi:hypothetical protein